MEDALAPSSSPVPAESDGTGCGGGGGGGGAASKSASVIPNDVVRPPLLRLHVLLDDALRLRWAVR